MELKRRNFLYFLGTLAAIGLTGAFDALKGLIKSPKGRLEPRYGIGLGAKNRDEIKLLTASLDSNKEFEELTKKVTENIR